MLLTWHSDPTPVTEVQLNLFPPYISARVDNNIWGKTIGHWFDMTWHPASNQNRYDFLKWSSQPADWAFLSSMFGESDYLASYIVARKIVAARYWASRICHSYLLRLEPVLIGESMCEDWLGKEQRGRPRLSWAAVTTPLLEIAVEDVAYCTGKFVLEVRKKDGQKYQPNTLHVLVCCFKCFFEQMVECWQFKIWI